MKAKQNKTKQKWFVLFHNYRVTSEIAKMFKDQFEINLFIWQNTHNVYFVFPIFGIGVRAFVCD